MKSDIPLKTMRKNTDNFQANMSIRTVTATRTLGQKLCSNEIVSPHFQEVYNCNVIILYYLVIPEILLLGVRNSYLSAGDAPRVFSVAVNGGYFERK